MKEEFCLMLPESRVIQLQHIELYFFQNLSSFVFSLRITV